MDSKYIPNHRIIQQSVFEDNEISFEDLNKKIHFSIALLEELNKKIKFEIDDVVWIIISENKKQYKIRHATIGDKKVDDNGNIFYCFSLDWNQEFWTLETEVVKTQEQAREIVFNRLREEIF